MSIEDKKKNLIRSHIFGYGYRYWRLYISQSNGSDDVLPCFHKNTYLIVNNNINEEEGKSIDP